MVVITDVSEPTKEKIIPRQRNRTDFRENSDDALEKQKNAKRNLRKIRKALLNNRKNLMHDLLRTCDEVPCDCTHELRVRYAVANARMRCFMGSALILLLSVLCFAFILFTITALMEKYVI